MKLRDKETGVILDDCKISLKNKWGAMAFDPPRTLKELVERFEDVKEPKEYWCIDWTEFRGIYKTKVQDERDEFNKEIGNYFETEKEAKQAVEKLKAWKRLKDKGFEFESWFGGSKDISFWIDTEIDENIAKDLDLLFRGEE